MSERIPIGGTDADWLRFWREQKRRDFLTAEAAPLDQTKRAIAEAARAFYWRKVGEQWLT